MTSVYEQGGAGSAGLEVGVTVHNAPGRDVHPIDKRTAQHQFPALTGIRFPLALWVISYHLSSPGLMWDGLFSEPMLATVISRAYVALGTFFALSGFLLAYTYGDALWNGSSLVRYSIHRAARILPLYYFSLLVVSPIILQQVQERPSLIRADIIFGHLFLLQGWARPPVDWNTPAWSLSCEVFFYACFPLIAWFLPRKRSHATWLLITMAFGVPVVVRLIQPLSDLKPFVYFGDFLVGMACAAIFGSRPARRLFGRGYLLYLPAGLLGGALLLWGGVLSWLAFDELMRVVNALAVLGLAFGGGRAHALLSTSWMVAGGAASFAAYILHIPVLWWFRRYQSTTMPEIAAGFLYVGIVLLAAVAASGLVEFPANRWIREKFAGRKRVAQSTGKEMQPQSEPVESMR